MPYLREQQLISLQSTTYPGTTNEIILPILTKKGFEIGKNFFLSFSPERLDPGIKKVLLKNNFDVSLALMSELASRIRKSDQ